MTRQGLGMGPVDSAPLLLSHAWALPQSQGWSTAREGPSTEEEEVSFYLFRFEFFGASWVLWLLRQLCGVLPVLRRFAHSSVYACFRAQVYHSVSVQLSLSI